MSNQSFKYPVFFSYARADDKRTSGYIKNFQSAFRDALAGQMTTMDLPDHRPFLDVDELMGKTGDLSERLQQEIESSFALYIFLGEAYLKSDWCFREIKYFSECHKGKKDVMKARVWILQLDDLNPDQKSRFRERLEEAGAPELAEYLRQNLYDANSGKRPLIYMENGTVFQGTSENIFQPFAEELTKQIVASRPMPPKPVIPPYEDDVLVLAPHKDLDNLCSRLRDGLAVKTRKLRVLTWDDLGELDQSGLVQAVLRAKLVVFPLLASETQTEQGVAKPRIQRQLDACRPVLQRTIFWVPTELPVPGSANPPAPNERMASGILSGTRNLSVEDLLKEIERRLRSGVSVENQIVVLVEQEDENDFRWEPMIEDLAKHWQNMCPDQSRNVGLVAAGLVTRKLMKQAVEGLAGNGRRLDGHAVIVFPDDTDEMMQNKCRMISELIPSWVTAQIPLTPGLIVQKAGGADLGSLVNYWPRARCNQTGEPPKEVIGAFEAQSKDSLKRFFERIEKLRAKACRSAAPVAS